MPFDEVMGKFKAGNLHSGSKKGPKVTSKDQAIAIMLHEKAEAEGGKEEYKSKKGKKDHPAMKGLKGAKPKHKHTEDCGPDCKM